MSYRCFDSGLVRMLGWGARAIPGQVPPQSQEVLKGILWSGALSANYGQPSPHWQEALCSCLSCPPCRVLSRQSQAELLPFPPGGLLDPPRKLSLSPGY